MASTNQYQAPSSNVDNTGAEEFSEIKVFGASGRLGRIRYIGYSMGFSLLGMIAIMLLGGLTMLTAGASAGIGVISGIVMLAVYVFLLVISILLTIQRCHDFNSSGWLSLLLLVPVAPLLFWLIPGTDGPNRFAAKTPPNSIGIMVLVLVMPIIFIAILAAVALPVYNEYIQAAQQAQLK